MFTIFWSHSLWLADWSVSGGCRELPGRAADLQLLLQCSLLWWSDQVMSGLALLSSVSTSPVSVSPGPAEGWVLQKYVRQPAEWILALQHHPGSWWNSHQSPQDYSPLAAGWSSNLEIKTYWWVKYTILRGNEDVVSIFFCFLMDWNVYFGSLKWNSLSSM